MIDGAYILAGALTGFVVGLTGVGGGALMTPILLIVFSMSPATTVATDLWFAAITKIAGARVHHKNGQVDWQVVKRLWAGSLPVAALTVFLVSFGSRNYKIEWLTKAIGIVLLVTAVGLLLAPKLLQHARDRRIGNPERFKAIQPALTVLAGAFGRRRCPGQCALALSVPLAHAPAQTRSDRYRACDSVSHCLRRRLSVRGYGGLVGAG
jgi:uncharacterized membrane protein YfcA